MLLDEELLLLEELLLELPGLKTLIFEPPEDPSLKIELKNLPTLPLEKVFTVFDLGEEIVMVLFPVLGSVIKVALPVLPE